MFYKTGLLSRGLTIERGLTFQYLRYVACLPILFSFFSVENENHCDFTKLREMLIRTNMEDLRDTTHSRHYELYRKDRLKEVRTFRLQTF